MAPAIDGTVDLELYPLHRGGSAEWRELVEFCRAGLDERGMYDLPGFLRSGAIAETVSELVPLMATASFEHRRRHNIYFRDQVEGLPAEHPALAEVETVNHTLCADQLPGSALLDLYQWPPFRAFVAATMQLPTLYLMDDPLASVNVISYRPGEALNWHFDRSEFTTTLLLQRPTEGGVFEYRSDLRTNENPNYDGVGRLLANADPDVAAVDVTPGALNVFRGRNTAHRVTTVGGQTERMIAVFSFYDHPGVAFGDDESRRFYGRSSGRFSERTATPIGESSA